MDQASPHRPRSEAPREAGREAQRATALPPGWSRRTARFVFAVSLLAIGAWVISDFLTPLLWSVVIVLSLWPAYRWACKRLPQGGRRIVAPLLFTFLTAVIFLVPLGFVLSELGREGQRLVDAAVRAQHQGLPAPAWLPDIPLAGEQVTRWWQAHLADPAGAKATLGELDIRRLAGWTQSLGAEVLHRALLFLVTLLAIFALFRDGEQLGRHLLAFTDRLLGHPGERLAEKMGATVRGTVVGNVLVASCQGALIAGGYLLAGVPSPFLFGALTVACAMVPSGAWVAFTLAVLVHLAQDGSVLSASLVWGWGAVVMLVGDNFVLPRMIGGAIRLPVLSALVGILGGIQTFGVIGIFLGPVIIAALITLWREWVLGEAAK